MRRRWPPSSHRCPLAVGELEVLPEVAVRDESCDVGEIRVEPPGIRHPSVLLAFAAAAFMRSASATVVVMGFSHSTWQPCSNAAHACSACRAGGEAMMARSYEPSRNAAAQSGYARARLNLDAIWRPRDSLGSTTPKTSTAFAFSSRCKGNW